MKKKVYRELYYGNTDEKKAEVKEEPKKEEKKSKRGKKE